RAQTQRRQAAKRYAGAEGADGEPVSVGGAGIEVAEAFDGDAAVAPTEIAREGDGGVGAGLARELAIEEVGAAKLHGPMPARDAATDDGSRQHLGAGLRSPGEAQVGRIAGADVEAELEV